MTDLSSSRDHEMALIPQLGESQQSLDCSGQRAAEAESPEPPGTSADLNPVALPVEGIDSDLTQDPFPKILEAFADIRKNLVDAQARILNKFENHAAYLSYFPKDQPDFKNSEFSVSGKPLSELVIEASNDAPDKLPVLLRTIEILVAHFSGTISAARAADFWGEKFSADGRSLSELLHIIEEIMEALKDPPDALSLLEIAIEQLKTVHNQIRLATELEIPQVLNRIRSQIEILSELHQNNPKLQERIAAQLSEGTPILVQLNAEGRPYMSYGKTIEDISDLRDGSDHEGMRHVMELTQNSSGVQIKAVRKLPEKLDVQIEQRAQVRFLAVSFIIALQGVIPSRD